MKMIINECVLLIIQVMSEDAACRIFMSWLSATDRSSDEVESVAGCLRLPHITLDTGKRLMECLNERNIHLVSGTHPP